MRAASRARAAVRHFSMIRRPSAGFSSRYWPRPSATAAWTWPLTSALPSLALVWPSNCGSVSLTLMTAVRPSRTSSPERLRVVVLEDAGPARLVVERARQRRPEAGDVGAAVDGVDVVGEGEDVLGVASRCTGARPRRRSRPRAARRRSAGCGATSLFRFRWRTKRLEAALEVERALAVVALVDEADPDALGQVGRLAQALRDQRRTCSRWSRRSRGRPGSVVVVPRRSPCGPSFVTGVVGLPRSYSWPRRGRRVPTRPAATRTAR